MSALDTTKRRLLEAAEAVFADRGYEAASVREICSRAGANIAAVNYHFGDKERLYIEAVKNAHRCIDGDLPLDFDPAAPPAVRLRTFIRTMAVRMTTEQRETAHRLMMRELSQPTAACGEVVRDHIRPMADILRGILREMLPAGTPDDALYLAGFSIVGQVLMYKQSRPICAHLMGPAFADLTADRIADHVTRFTLGGLAALTDTGAVP